MDAKIFEILAKKAAEWKSQKLWKNLQNDLGSLPGRSRGFAGFGHPVGVPGPNVGILPCERDDPKGPQSNHKK